MNNDSQSSDIIYKRKNGFDIVNDTQAINSCKREQSRDIIDNARLGSYDKFGNYIIIPEIKRELVNMPKLIYNVSSNPQKKIFELRGNLPIFNSLFMKLIITKDSADLYICESVKREAGGYLEVFDEVVDSLAIGQEEKIPEHLILSNYHIYSDPNDFGKKLDGFVFDSILTRKVYLSLLSKSLKNVSKVDEKQSFKDMLSVLKTGGEYGQRVINTFLDRLKDRPAIFEITNQDNYNKALNEVMLSSIEIATTEEDKQNLETRQTYLEAISARDKFIEDDLKLAVDKVSEDYVCSIVTKAKAEFKDKDLENEEEQTASEDFFNKLNESENVRVRRHTLDKPILKQGREASKEPNSKEDKIKEILNKNSEDLKPQPKLKPAKELINNKLEKEKSLILKAKEAETKQKEKQNVAIKPKAKSNKKVKKASKQVKNKKTLKVKRKLAKKGLKAKKGKLKSKKKKLKKSKNLNGAKKKALTLKPAVKKESFSSKPKKKEQKKSLALIMNLLDKSPQEIKAEKEKDSNNIKDFFTTKEKLFDTKVNIRNEINLDKPQENTFIDVKQQSNTDNSFSNEFLKTKIEEKIINNEFENNKANFLDNTFTHSQDK